MPLNSHMITPDDILDEEEYAKIRPARRKAMLEIKKNRRVHIGPDATAYFENFATVSHQIQEMLHIEKGGEEQLQAELRAYNPLIPSGRKLVCTLMFEIEDAERRQAFLAHLGGVENTLTLRFDGETITGIPEADVDRTSATGKASSVQFLHFPFTDIQANKFKMPKTKAILGIGHEFYAHAAPISETVRAALADDLE